MASGEEPGEPCCNIIATDGVNNVIYGIETATRRMFQVAVSASDITGVRVGDTIDATIGPGPGEVHRLGRQVRSYSSVLLPDGWTPSRVFDPVGLGAVREANLPGVNVPSPDAAEPCCSVRRNPELAGLTGRMVVNAPADGAAYQFVEIMKAGNSESVASWSGNRTLDLVPGTYDVVVNGVRVEGVVVERQSETPLRLGALVVGVGGATSWEVFGRSRDASLYSRSGPSTIALPVGTHSIAITGGFIDVDIRENEVTGL